MRRWAFVMACLFGAAGLACGGKSGSSTGVVNPPPGPTAIFKCSDSSTVADRVVLQCGMSVAPDIWMINMVIGVPTTSNNIGGFAFDVVFDPTVLAYIDGSAVMGNLFTQYPAGTYLFAAKTTSDPGRLVVGIQPVSTPGLAGNTGHDQILRFELKNLSLSNWGPDLVRIENFRVTDSSGLTISGITTNDQLLLSMQ